MNILHVTAECYPVAKAGGLGDVASALPKYLSKLGHSAAVVMPMYRTRFLYQNEWSVKFKGRTNMGDWWFDYTIIKEKTNKLGFDLYLVDINNLLDRENIYGYSDDTERFIAFQIAVVNWINYLENKPDIIHCHDYHTGFIPFMIKHCYGYNKLADIPTVLTIHNAQYQGWMGWDKSIYIPSWDSWKGGALEWGDCINALATGIKNAWAVTTVSWSYLDELKHSANGLETLFEYEKGKCAGILNGIDTEVWNPATDKFISKQYNTTTADKGKKASKTELCKEFGLDEKNPLIIFIGRLVGDKAADVLPDAILSSLYHLNNKVNFLVLGNGDPYIEGRLNAIRDKCKGYYNTYIGYDETLSHKMYAGADFLLMPSRVEPCGLNQMYAMKYGTIPMVRNTGGLRDTVIDMDDWEGWGIRFEQASVEDITDAISRAVELYQNKDLLNKMRVHMMNIDNSWEHSAQQYVNIYTSIKK